MCAQPRRGGGALLPPAPVPVEEWVSKAAFTLLQPQLAQLRAPYGGDTQAACLQADGFAV